MKEPCQTPQIFPQKTAAEGGGATDGGTPKREVQRAAILNTDLTDKTDLALNEAMCTALAGDWVVSVGAFGGGHVIGLVAVPIDLLQCVVVKL